MCFRSTCHQHRHFVSRLRELTTKGYLQLDVYAGWDMRLPTTHGRPHTEAVCAGGEFHVGLDGAVYNMTSSENRLQIIRYEMSR